MEMTEFEKKGFWWLGGATVVVAFFILIGYGVSLVRMANHERKLPAVALLQQQNAAASKLDINDKLKGDLAHTRYLLGLIEEAKSRGEKYSPQEEAELRQEIFEMQSLLKKRELQAQKKPAK